MNKNKLVRISWQGILFSTLLLQSPQAYPAADSILSEMSLREKIGQMILVYHSPRAFLAEHGIGGVLIMQNMLRDASKLAEELKSIQESLPIPLLVTIDQEGGTVNRLSSVKGWRQTHAAADLAQLNPDTITQYGLTVAETLRELYINTNLAPVLDPAVDHTGRKTFMAVKRRSFGTGVAEITGPARAFMQGCKKEQVLCVVKHFPGYDVPVNSDHDIAVSDADSMAVAGNIAVFRELQHSFSGIMMSSIHYRSFCKEPAVFSPLMVTLARECCGEKIIMTDDLWATALRSYMLPGRPLKRASYPPDAFTRLVEQTVRAGNDMLMITYPKMAPVMIDIIEKQAAQEPGISDHINKAAWRIIKTKIDAGLLQ